MKLLSNVMGQRVLPILNLLLFIGLVVAGLKKEANPSDAPEKITLVSSDGKQKIEIGFFEGKGVIRFVDEKGHASLSLLGGEEPAISLNNKKGVALASLSLASQEEGHLSFNDAKNVNRLELKGGNLPSIYLKDSQEMVAGSWSLFHDGGCGIGLAANNGMVATILRGGDKPGLAFYDQSELPGAVFGLMEKVPHLLITADGGEEGVLIHGGKPSGMMVLDETGQLKVFISKHGIYQGKEKAATEAPKEKQKFFSLDEELKSLFPKKNQSR